MPNQPSSNAMEAIARAERETGIPARESSEFVEALDAFYSFAYAKAPTAEGLAGLDQMAHRLLVNRLRFADDLARHPEILEEDVSDPIVVLGFPRSGTTVLQRMMSADPANQSLRFWRLLNPAPIPPERPAENFERLEYARKVETAIRVHNPALHAAHPCVADDADEDWNLHHLTFAHVGHIFTGLPDVDYLAYLRTLPRQPSYNYVADVLRYLQWQDGGRRGRRWILKSPVHVGHLPQMLRAHPKATFVYLRRDFNTVVASFCNALEASLQPHLALEPAAIGRIALEYWGAEMKAFAHDRVALGDALRMLELDYKALLSDPIPHIRRVYEEAGTELTESGLEAIRNWIEDNPAGKHGVNQYTLVRYGLSDDDVARTFG